MKRGGPLKRTPLRRRNPERYKRRRADQFGKQAKLCESSNCCLPICAVGPPRVVAHHEPTRAAGGKDRDTVPLCVPHHGERHQVGVETFQEKYGIDLRGITARMSDLVGYDSDEGDDHAD